MKKIKINITENCGCADTASEPLKKMHNIRIVKEKKNCGCGQDPCVTYGRQEESSIEEEVLCEVDMYHNLYEAVQDAITEDNEHACAQCLYEILADAACDCSEMISEAE